METSREVTEQVSGDDAIASPPWIPVLAILLWCALWYLTPGLHTRGVGALVGGESASVLVETGAALMVLILIALLQWCRTAELFARSRWTWAYALPVVLALALPFHYTLPLLVGVYMVWMAVSVLCQQHLTFGLLQSHLRDRRPAAVTIPLVAAVFYLGHALLIP